MDKRVYAIVGLVVMLLASPSVLAQGQGNACSVAGTWYGGSVVAYQMTIAPMIGSEQFMVIFQGAFKTAPLTTFYSGTLTKRNGKYEGSMMALGSQNPEILNPPPLPFMPDVEVGWVSIELLDCNVIRNTIPFLGLYFGPPPPFSPFGNGIWEPGSPWTGISWVADAKTPLVDPPDVDFIPILTGDSKPIVETYHRLPASINPSLLHQ